MAGIDRYICNAMDFDGEIEHKLTKDDLSLYKFNNSKDFI